MSSFLPFPNPSVIVNISVDHQASEAMMESTKWGSDKSTLLVLVILLSCDLKDFNVSNGVEL
ncbi:hypothetical protein Lalb_Chr03g0042451 [Lupinus albus]|uniref:Uncharacterized protein n=1 Tax=Lupinus albus TaxID=3870 RepID=A0A6A4QWZ5_LUPAL|nr:hypothetical protein Lalb_Chr03g0042451 [Lupinus albus]